MKHKLKNLSFRAFLTMSVISLAVLIALLTFFMRYAYKAMEENHKVIDESMELLLASNYLQKGSDTLTENVRLFVLTQDEKYAHNFITEAYENKTRENALEILNSHYFYSDHEMLKTIKTMSDTLLEKELWLMRLVYESKNSENIPDVVAQVKLSDEELTLNSHKLYNLARNYLLLGEYTTLKANIDLAITDFNFELNEVSKVKIAETNKFHRNLSIHKFYVFLLFVLWCITLLIILNNQIITPALAYIKIYQQFDYFSGEPLLVSPKGMKEIYRLGAAYNDTMISLNKLKSTIQEQNIQLQRQKNIDPLTGVYNRGFFDTIEWEEIENLDYTIFCIDINKFKSINDTHGHLVGDNVLKFLTLNLQNSIRKTDTVVRMGGDEFVLIIRDAIDAKSVNVLFNKLEELQGNIFSFDEVNIPIYFGYGGASHAKGTNSFSEVLHLADRQMYKNKKYIKNKFTNME